MNTFDSGKPGRFLIRPRRVTLLAAVLCTAAGAVELDETRSFVLEALSVLPENQQEACRLKFQDELTYREISQVMGISLGTVSNLITTALDSVRQQLRARPDLAQEA